MDTSERNKAKGFSFANLGISTKFTALMAVGLLCLFTVIALLTLNLQRNSLDRMLVSSRQAVEQMSTEQLALNKKSGKYKAAQLTKMLAQIAPEPIVSFGFSSLVNYANVSAEDPDIAYVAFKSNEGNTLASAGDESILSKSTVFRKDVVQDDVKIGEVVVGYVPDRINAQGKMIKSSVEERLHGMEQTRDASLRKAGANLAMLFILVAALAALLAFFVARSVTRSLAMSVDVADRIAAGDLTTSDFDIKSNDESGRLLKALKDMNERLVMIVGNVKDATGEIIFSSEELAKGNHELAVRTEEQASSLEETAASMEEMTSSVKGSAINIDQANQLAKEAREHAASGGDVVRQAIEAMQDINESSKKISDIVNVIDEIAFQTNLLALNAAVEAARAGEQGRGFAVVASEVRSLAQRSSTSANEVRNLIKESIEKIESGAELVNASGSALEEIVNGVQKVSEINAQLANTSQEQTAGIDQVNNAVTRMDEMTQSNAALVDSTSGMSRQLESRARDLGEIIDFFKIRETSLHGIGYQQDAAIEDFTGADQDEAGTGTTLLAQNGD